MSAPLAQSEDALARRAKVMAFGWLGVFAGLAALTWGVALSSWPPLLLPAGAVALLCGGVALAHTQLGLCIVAFAIVPLGVIQVELLSITVNLPEALILLLFAKEALRFVLREERPVRGAPWAALGLYLLASVIALATGLRNGNGLAPALQDFRQFAEYLALYLLVLHRVATRRQATQILAAFVSGGFLIAVHGVLQHFTGIGIPGHQMLSDLIYHGGARSGSFYGATPLGAIMVLTLGPTLGLILNAKNKRTRLLLYGVAATLVCAAVFTHTSASWVAMALLLIFFFFSMRKTPAAIMAAMAAAVLFSAVLGPFVYQRMAKLRITKSERSLHQRMQYYATAWHIFRAHPVFGLGWGCYYNQAEILANGRYVPAKAPARIAESAPGVTVHSAYLQLLVKSGALGLLAFGLVLLHWLLLARKAYQRESRDEAGHHLFIGVTASLAGYLLHSAFENFFQWPVMSQAFWLLMGLSTIMALRLAEHGGIGHAPPGAET